MLIGRDRELDVVTERLRSARFLVLRGAAGVGKTTLMGSAAEAAPRRLLTAGSLATLSWVAYLPITRALGHPPVGDDTATVAAEVRATVGSGTLFLDDLQWADPETLALIPFFAGDIAFVGALRSGDPGEEHARSVAVDAGAEIMDLDDLDDVDAARVARSVRPDLDEMSCREILLRAGGNPLLLCELAAGGLQSPDLAAAVRERLAPLSERATDAMHELALLGRPAPDGLIDHGAEELFAAGLVVATDDGWTIRHALIADAALVTLPCEERRAIHARLAERLDDPGEAARHALAAGEPRRARELAQVAFERATQPPEQARALALMAEAASGPEATELRLQAARALLATGQHGAVPGLVGNLDGDAGVSAEAALYLARAYERDDPCAMARAIEAGLAVAPDERPATRARLLAARTRIPITGGAWDPQLAIAYGEEAVAAAADAGIDGARAANALAEAHLTAGSIEWGEHFDRALVAAMAAGDVDEELEARKGRLTAQIFFGETRAGLATARDAVGRARATGARHQELEFAGILVFLRHLLLDRLDELVGELEGFLREPLPLPIRSLALGELAFVLADTGALDRAGELIARALEPGRASPSGLALLWWIRGEIDLLAGRPRAAIEAIDACGAAISPGSPLLMLAPVTRSWALLTLRRPVNPPLPELPFPSMAGATKESEGLVAFAERDFAAAAPLFAEAAERWSATMVRSELRCRWAAAFAVKETGDRDAAVEQLLALETRTAEAGLIPALGLVRRSLRQAGIERRAIRSASRQALSTREDSVLALVGEGLCSVEIASRLGLAATTVDDTIETARAKLGARTRIQAAVTARAHRNQERDDD